MLIIAHRGARAVAPENTLAAIQSAIDSGAKAIEIDIHQHNGEFWVIHDKWLHRTTNGTGLLTEHSTKELRHLDAGNGESIPTLWQVLSLVSGQCALNIELKSIFDFSLLYQHLDDACQTLNFHLNQFIVSSFNHHWLQHIRDTHPKILIGALTGSKNVDNAAFAQRLNSTSINIDLDVIDKHYVDDAKQRGLKVFIYTVNQPRDWKWLAQLGVDGVFCDDPQTAIQYYPQPSHYHWDN